LGPAIGVDDTAGQRASQRHSSLERGDGVPRVEAAADRVTERHGHDALADQRSHLVLDQFGPARVMEAGGEAIHQPHRAIGGAKQ
jgi:hypothetical protein